MNKYYFSIFISFKKDIDLYNFEKAINLEATNLTFLKDSFGEDEEKTADFYYRTDEHSNIYSDDEFEKFLFSLKDNFQDLPEILREFDGECGFSLVFTEVNEPPCISLSKETINFLNFLNARFDVDFV